MARPRLHYVPPARLDRLAEPTGGDRTLVVADLAAVAGRLADQLEALVPSAVARNPRLGDYLRTLIIRARGAIRALNQTPETPK